MFKYLARISILLTLSLVLFSQILVSASSNTTNFINVDLLEQSDKINLNYTIEEKFNVSSHGVFLALPKSQDGIWTEYKIKKVTRSEKLKPKEINVKEIINDYKNGDKTPNLSQLVSPTGFKDEKYELIKEWNEFRLRIGDKDKKLEIGTYQYQIEIEATKSSDYKYNFNLINDWQESVGSIKVTKNEVDLCISKIKCDKSSTSLQLNQDKNSPPFYHKIWNSLWIYLVILISLILSFGILWSLFARDPSDGLSTDKPEFEPPQDIYPWQAQYLINEGQVGIKDALLSYFLWLNTHKYLKLKPILNPKEGENEKIKVEIIKDLPENVLPPIFNKTILEISEKGLQAGLLSSKIQEAKDGESLNKKVYEDLKKYYDQKPIYQPIGIAVGICFVAGFILAISFEGIQNSFLIGNSWVGPLIFAGIVFFIGLCWILRLWGKLSREGFEVRAYCQRYRFYLDKAEKFKLDFSNNPDEGVQYYLKAVSFAAAFGILAQFQAYFAKLMPNISEVQDTNSFYTGYIAASFYAPPSDSSSGGGDGGGGGFSGGGGSW